MKRKVLTSLRYAIIIELKFAKRKQRKEGLIVFRNLEAEQARFGLTNQQMADKIGISRISYENKKKTGKFTALEAKRMCRIFKTKFDYLFETEEKGE